MSTSETSRPAATSAERLVMLLSFVGFLRDRDCVPVAELAERFHTSPEEVRELVAFLGTAGVPGDTQHYQHEDLFDIDWDALELRDEVSLTQVIAVDDAPRFAPAETAALIAGLHALAPMLPTAEAARAQTLSAKLARALGGPAAALSLAQDPRDGRVTTIFEALREDRLLKFGYRDASGRATVREVRPLSLQQDGDAWYLRGFCLTRGAERSFRVAQITDLEAARLVVDSMQGSAQEPAHKTASISGAAKVNAPTASAASYELIATVPVGSLGGLAGFAPRIIEEFAPGMLRVAIEAWHDALALQLMRVAPGRITIESPVTARAAVHEWANRALAAYDE